MNLVQIILETTWLLLPAAIANTAPVIAAQYGWAKTLNWPISTKLFGAHKTMRGLLMGAVFGSLAGFIQYLLFHIPAIQAISLVPYEPWTFALWLGWLLGFGALVGDLVKSFFKRRRNIAPGKSWPIFDQIDAPLGALLVVAPIVPLTLLHGIIALIIFGPLSFIVSYIGIKLKMKNSL